MCASLETLFPKARERGCQSKTSRRAVAESATWPESCQELQKFCIALYPVVLFLPFNAVEWDSFEVVNISQQRETFVLLPE